MWEFSSCPEAMFEPADAMKGAEQLSAAGAAKGGPEWADGGPRLFPFYRENRS